MDLDEVGGGCFGWLLEDVLWDLLFVGTGHLVLLPFGVGRGVRGRRAGWVGLATWVVLGLALYLGLS